HAIAVELYVLGRHAEARRFGFEAGNEPSQLWPVGAQLGIEVLGRTGLGIPREGLDERLVRNERLLVAPAVEHVGTGGVRQAGELADEAGLADPRLAADQDNTALAAGEAREHAIDLRQLGAASDEDGREMTDRPRQRNGRCGGRWRPRQRPRRQPRGAVVNVFQHRGGGVLELEASPRPDEGAHEIGHNRLTGLGAPTQLAGAYDG